MSRILILSQDPDDSILSRRILEIEGYECITVATPQDTLYHLRTSDINVLHIVDPDGFSFDGWEFYRQLRSDPELCQIPVIIYTPWFPSSAPNPADYGDTLFLMPMDIESFVEKFNELTSAQRE